VGLYYIPLDIVGSGCEKQKAGEFVAYLCLIFLAYTFFGEKYG
jgi:hypothetical protein